MCWSVCVQRVISRPWGFIFSMTVINSVVHQWTIIVMVRKMKKYEQWAANNTNTSHNNCMKLHSGFCTMVPTQVWNKNKNKKNKQRGQAPWVYSEARAAMESSTNIKMFGVHRQLYNEDLIHLFDFLFKFKKRHPPFQRDTKGRIHINCRKLEVHWSYEQHFVFSGLDLSQKIWQVVTLWLRLRHSAVEKGLQRKVMVSCHLHKLLWADYHSH